MSNMVLGVYTFADNPGNLPIIQQEMDIAYARTLTSVGIFDFGPTFAGVKIPLEWEFMTTGQYDTHLAQRDARASLVWDPQDGSGKTFNAWMVYFNGEYHLYLENSTGNYRKKVKMELLILSEVSA